MPRADLRATAQDVIDLARIILQDPDGDRWDDTELLLWLNSAQRAAASAKPNTMATSDTVSLVEGAWQSVPEDGFQLLSVERVFEGQAMEPVEKAVLDRALKGWQSETPTPSPRNYVYDEQTPYRFAVYPPAQAGTQIELVYAKTPNKLTTTNAVIAFDPVYEAALAHYVCFMAYSKDSDNAANTSRAQGHRALFESHLGVRTVRESDHDPGVAQTAG